MTSVYVNRENKHSEEEHHVEKERDLRDASTSQERPRIIRHHQKLGEQHGNRYYHYYHFTNVEIE